jgi:hypothetical protein
MVTWSTLGPIDPADDQGHHTRPLDSVLVSLSEADCATCLAILAMLKSHLELASVPALARAA